MTKTLVSNALTSNKTFVCERIQNLPFSGIRKFFDIASEMQDVISLGVGEPDFDTPWNIREEAIYRLEAGNTVYTSNAGLLDLRKAISKYMFDRFDLRYDYSDQILATVGASEGIDIALRAILDPGDEVLVVEPCFVSYRPCVTMAGGVPITIGAKAENDFRVTPEELSAKINSKTKALLISYPNNPTGAIMEKSDLEQLADVLRERDIVVISDEIYAELTYGQEHVSIASLPGMAEKTIVVNGFSKAFSMTGWRLGFVCGPKEIIEAMLKIHQYIVMCAPSVSQYAGIEALKNSADSVRRMQKEYNGRRRVMLNGFNKMGLTCFEPRGAFYVFPCIKSTGLSSEDFCTKLLYEQKVAAVPGNAFGESGEGFIRCSYATGIRQLREALNRIRSFLDN
ncbi:MAG: aminotransferase class I/II-fold pyridoxal phosphate-dependent enzyme [Clostridiales bacterium]|jgi:aminotransferase|nr:aminotransferase class I/II-fold pyridoxal phosphate-dependent enzyme [Clostridiales bacterium]